MTETTDTSRTEIPQTCIPDLSVVFDINRDWPCKRAAFIYHLHTFRADIDQTAKRLARTSSPRVARNLTNWIADAEVRLAKLSVRTLTALLARAVSPVCTASRTSQANPCQVQGLSCVSTCYWPCKRSY